jgi:hypothetical protein
LATRRTRRTHAAQAVSFGAGAIVLLLLPRRELAKLLQRLVDLVVCLLLLLLLLAALHRLVLIAETVLLQLEDVGQVLCVRAIAAATTATTAHRDLDLAEHCFRALQLLERELFRRQRCLRRSVGERLLGRVHRGRRLGKNVGDLLPVAVGARDAALNEARRELVGLLAQALLRQPQRREVLLQSFLIGQRAVA